MDFGDLLPPRSVEDILAERVRLVIGGEVYDLPVLTIRENRAWRERMDRELGELLLGLSVVEDTDEVLALFDGAEHLWLDLLLSYDKTGLLPAVEDIEAGLSPMGLVRSVLEVWRAARPLADIARAGMDLPTEIRSASWRQRMSSLLRPTGGQHDASRQN